VETPRSPQATTPRRIVASYGSDMDSPVHSMLGLAALTGAMQDLGVGIDALFEGVGVSPEQMSDPGARLSHRQKIALFGNVQRLTPDPTIGLMAGQRQRISDYGVYGYGVLSSATFGEAIAFGIEHIRLAGPVLEKSFRVEGEVAVFEGHDVIQLGPLLPLVTEFWFSSMRTLISCFAWSLISRATRCRRWRAARRTNPPATSCASPGGARGPWR